MEEKKPFATRLEAFFAGKGFYIVLFLCVAVIGLAAWSMLSGTGEESGNHDALSMAVSNMEDNVVTDKPPVTGTSAPVASPAPGTVTATPAPVSIPEAPVPTKTPDTAETAGNNAPSEVPVPVETKDYYIWPVVGEIENGYSMAALTFNRTMQDWRTHDGVDIAAELGTQVKAAANGRVAEIRSDDMYGTTVILSHRDGLVSIYSNLAATPTVSVGDQVSVGQVIGAVGDTALAEAGEVCHLHFAMMLDSESVDPTEYMP